MFVQEKGGLVLAHLFSYLDIGTFYVLVDLTSPANDLAQFHIIYMFVQRWMIIFKMCMFADIGFDTFASHILILPLITSFYVLVDPATTSQ